MGLPPLGGHDRQAAEHTFFRFSGLIIFIKPFFYPHIKSENDKGKLIER